MLVSILFLAMVLPVELSSYCEKKDDSAIIGVAFDVQDKRFLYCERHVIDWQKNSTTIEYLDKARHVFAKKSITYVGDIERPNITQNDFRQGEFRSSIRENNAVVMSYKKNEEARLKVKRVNLDRVDMIDAGFDHFVRSNWKLLTSGEKMSSYFASVLHLQNINLRLSSQPTANCPPIELDGQYFCFWADINNRFLRMFTPRLRFVYDKSQRLRVFEGVVNILSDKNKSQAARIYYYYNEDLLKPNK